MRLSVVALTGIRRDARKTCVMILERQTVPSTDLAVFDAELVRVARAFFIRLPIGLSHSQF
jgi:hypothetical protein